MSLFVSTPTTNQTNHLPICLKTRKQPSKAQTAKRLADTKRLNHEQWLDVRKQGIGSSDAPTVCGLNPYMSMLELWLIKTGRTTPSETQTDGYAPLYWGKQLEPLVAKYYSQKTGRKIRRVNAVLQHPDSDKSFMLANLDYAVVGSDVHILEIKTTGEHGSKLWKNGVPLYVTCQVQHQLAVTGKQIAHICLLNCGHEAKIFEVKRDDNFIEWLIQAEKQFWQYVESDTPPPADASESAKQAILQLYPKENLGEQVDFRDNQAVNDLFNQLIEQKQLLEQQEQQVEKLKHQLQQHIQTAEVALFHQGSISWKKTKDSISFDSKALLKDKPELFEQYQQVKQGSRRFLINLY